MRGAPTPARRRSRLLSASALGLAVRNPSFMAVPGVVALALLWSTQFGLRSLGRPGRELRRGGGPLGLVRPGGRSVRSSVSAVLFLVLFGGLWAFAKPPAWAAHGTARCAAKMRRRPWSHLALQVARAW